MQSAKRALRTPVPLPTGVDPLLAGAIAAAVGARIFYWAYTGRRLEDALITITHAVNAAEGHGLVHHAGEGHIHGFTSAVAVLIPLAGELLHSGWGLLFLRLASLVAAVITIVYANRLAALLEVSRRARGLLLTFLPLDLHEVLFGMVG